MRMKKIDELFSVRSGNKLDYGVMTPKLDGVAFVSRTSQNNGVVGYVEEINGIKPFDEGLITVSLGGSYVLSSFIQVNKFYTAQNVAVLEPLVEMELAKKLYYCRCISMNRYKYSAFGREANRTLKDILIPDLSELPDFVIDEKLPDYSSMTRPLVSDVFTLDSKEWKEYRYHEIFNINRGESKYLQDMKNGKYPYISATSNNNGISGYVNYYNAEENIISLNYDGSIGEAFYHDYKTFISEKVVSLTLKDHILNKYIALFLITLIKMEKYRFNYGLKWSVDSRMLSSKIRLPALSNGKPDFAYMENYIKSLPYSYSI
jgi:hypothetical protein